jgi:hypothetical protein
MLKFICSYFNFGNSKRIKTNYKKFRKYFPYPITTIEVALPKQKFFIDDSIKIRANYDNIFWQKERCLNIAIENLPEDTEYISWVDTDIRFYNDNLLEDTYKALESYPVVQLFEECFEKPNINRYNNNISIGSKIVNKLDHIKYPHIGYSWAFHKNVLIEDKLYDIDPVGNSDVLQLMTWLGTWNHACIIDLNSEYRQQFLLWAWDSYEKVESNIGYVSGKVEHFYHGRTEHRNYTSRNNILTTNNFSPSKDLEIDTNKLYKIKNSKLVEDIKDYLSQRSKYEYTQ